MSRISRSKKNRREASRLARRGRTWLFLCFSSVGGDSSDGRTWKDSRFQCRKEGSVPEQQGRSLASSPSAVSLGSSRPENTPSVLVPELRSISPPCLNTLLLRSSSKPSADED
nr:hypothetical protein Itr_chr09CG13840 [Ipomoea trifida]